MNDEIFKGNWEKIKGKIKVQWGKFTDDDIMKMNGKYQEFQGELQKKYGYQKEKAKEEIDTFIKKHGWK